MAIINLAGDGRLLNEITQHRPLASVPFGGRYRMIDFVLSSMVNSGVENVGILTLHPHRSLVDHLRSGGDWQLNSKKDGLVLLPPPYSEGENSYQGDLHSFRGNLDFLNKSSQDYVIVAGANVVGSLDYREAFRFHEETAADITFLYKKEDQNSQDCSNCAVADLQANNRIKAIRLNPAAGKGNFLLDTFILKKKLLTELVEGCGSRSTSLLREITANLACLRVAAFHYPGYIARIHCLPSYYRHSLSLLNPEIWRRLFTQSGHIYTKVRDEAPTRYTGQARVANALMAGGCLIAGGVENSVLFRRVKIGPEAQVRGSILMSNTEVGENALLENVICDKDVRISAGKHLRGTADNPLVIKKGTVI